MGALRPDTKVQFLKGIGSRRAEAFARLGVFTAQDLLWHLPHRYIDASQVTPLAKARVGDDVAAAHRSGKVAGVTLTLALRGSTPRDAIAVQFNGERLLPLYEAPVPAAETEDDHDRRLYKIPPLAVKQGDNVITVWIEGRENGSGAHVTLEEAWVRVRYT